jgi:flagellar assembly factor FliW
MRLNTLQLGSLEVAEPDFIRFDHGLPGFPALRNFVLCGGEEYEPFKYLLSVECPEIAFLLAAPELIDSKYDVQLTDEARSSLHWETTHTLAVYATVTLSSKPEETTANLMAPILINASTMRGFQLIQEGSKYPLRCRLIDTSSQSL